MSKSPVFIKMNGGLGNQMFQWAFARTLNVIKGYDVKLDMSFFDNKYARPYQLNVFALDAKFVNNSFDKFKLALLWKLRKNIKNKKIFGIGMYRESKFEYDSSVDAICPNTYVEGFFQTELYFNKIEQILREDFRFVEELDDLNKQIVDQMASCNSVSLHIRRGDYVQKKRYNDLYAHCSLDYYRNAINSFKSQFGEITVFVFSDDIDWVKSNLNPDCNCVYVTNNTGDKSYFDLRLMSSCKHNIIANSSFSWWGAWLNSNPDKVVIAPKKWFNDESVVQTDVIPKSWTQLEN